jgi:polar amino acid transport system substrate-binding protein
LLDQVPIVPPLKTAILLLVAVASILPGSLVRARDLSSVVIGYGEWPPFESPSLPDQGPVPTLVREALAAGGTQVEFKSLPWWRMLHEVEAGHLDGALIWRDVGDRRATFLLSDPLFTSRITLFFRKNEVRPWKKLADLSALRIGATASYRYCAEFDQLEEQRRLRVERAAADELNFAKLEAGRIDAMIVDSDYGRWRIAQMGDAADKIAEDTHPVCTAPMYLLISRAVQYGPALTERFNAGLRQMKANGRYDQLFDGIGQ